MKHKEPNKWKNTGSQVRDMRVIVRVWSSRMRREKNGWEITEIFPKLIKFFSPLIKKP